jgi:hypothetical protein
MNLDGFETPTNLELSGISVLEYLLLTQYYVRQGVLYQRLSIELGPVSAHPGIGAE